MYTGRFVHEIGIWDNTVAYDGTPPGWGHVFADKGVGFTSIGKLDFKRGAPNGISETILPTFRDNLDIHALYREEETQPRRDLWRKHMATGPDNSLATYESDGMVASHAARWLKENRPSDTPWVLYVNFNDLHRPWRPPQELWDAHAGVEDVGARDERFSEDRSQLHPYSLAYARHHNDGAFNDEDLGRMMTGYLGSVEILDRNVGQVLDALEEEDMREDTLIVYASDHGYSHGEHRHFEHGSMYEESLRVPLLFAGPGIERGRVVSEVVSMLDVFPTIGDAVGARKPEAMRGRSLLGLLQGDREEDPDTLAYCEYHASGYPSSMFAVCGSEFKYVRCVGERPMLFNLQEDPHEMRDLAALDPENLEVEENIHKFERILADVCSPEEVDARAKANQRERKEQMQSDGRLFKELAKRNYALNPDKLVYDGDPQA
jgi:choline-sulfatase